jgi:hypothetical protein
MLHAIFFVVSCSFLSADFKLLCLCRKPFDPERSYIRCSECK